MSSIHQGAIPHIMMNTNDEFFSKIIKLLKETAEICYSAVKEMKCITCPRKPEGSFFMMVRQYILHCFEATRLTTHSAG